MFNMSNFNYDELLDAVEQLYRSDTLPRKEYKKQASKLIQAAKQYGIHNEVKTILDDTPKIRPSEDQFPPENAPLRSPEEIKVATQWLLTYRNNFLYDTRKKLATRILQAAREQNVKLAKNTYNELCKTAGLGISSKKDIIEGIERRRQILGARGRGKVAKVLKMAAEVVNVLPIEELYKEGHCAAAVKLLDTVDNGHGLNQLYGTVLEYPENVFYGVSKDEIDSLQDEMIPNVKTGKCYSRASFSGLDPELLQEMLGEDVMHELTVGPVIDIDRTKEWLKTASSDVAELFDMTAEWCGIWPVAERIPEA